MKKIAWLFLCCVLAVTMIAWSCDGTSNGEQEEEEEEEEEEEDRDLSLAGSTTVQPVAQALADALMEQYPDISITVSGGGSSVGVTSCAERTVDIGMASRELKSSEVGTVIPVVIARDGIGIAVHPSQTVTEITMEQIQDVFAGNINNWSELGGDNEDILVVAREEGSGTRAAFEEIVMGDELITATAILQPSNGAVRTTIAGDPDAIGFLSMGYLDATVQFLDVDGVEATTANAASGAYPVVRPLNLLTKEEPSGLIKTFIDFALSIEGQSIIAEDYIMVIEPEGDLSLAGSTTVQPVAQALADALMEQYPNLSISVSGGGSSVGVTSCAERTVDIGMASRELKSSEVGTVIPVVIARDGIGIAVHPSQTVTEITMEQIRDVFAGVITNWSELGGGDEDILVVAREEGSGTRAAFEEIVMGDELITATAILQPSNGAVRTTVAGDPNAIGFLSMGYLDATVQFLDVDGVEATTANAASGAYPVVRPLNLLVKEEPSGLIKIFIDFALSNRGQAIVAEDYIPVN